MLPPGVAGVAFDELAENAAALLESLEGARTISLSDADIADLDKAHGEIVRGSARTLADATTGADGPKALDTKHSQTLDDAALRSTVVFSYLEPGRYAVIAFHDENGTGATAS